MKTLIVPKKVTPQLVHRALREMIEHRGKKLPTMVRKTRRSRKVPRNTFGRLWAKLLKM